MSDLLGIPGDVLPFALPPLLEGGPACTGDVRAVERSWLVFWKFQARHRTPRIIFGLYQQVHKFFEVVPYRVWPLAPLLTPHVAHHSSSS